MKKLVLGLLFLLFLNIVSAGLLQVTMEHPFLINNQWIPASQLQVGDLLTTIDGKKAIITGIEQINEPVQVYNLEDNWFHNYIVSSDNLIVHNSDSPTTTSTPGITVSQISNQVDRQKAAGLFFKFWNYRTAKMSTVDPQQSAAMKTIATCLRDDVAQSNIEQYNWKVCTQNGEKVVASIGLKPAALTLDGPGSQVARIVSDAFGKQAVELVHLAIDQEAVTQKIGPPLPSVFRKAFSEVDPNKAAVAVVNKLDSGRYIDILNGLARRTNLPTPIKYIVEKVDPLKPNDPNVIVRPDIIAALKEYYNGEREIMCGQKPKYVSAGKDSYLDLGNGARLEYPIVYIEDIPKMIRVIDSAPGAH